MVGGAEGVINAEMLAGGLAVVVEASGGRGGPEGMSGDTRPLGVVDMMLGSGYSVLLGLGLERLGDDAGVLTQSIRQWWSRMMGESRKQQVATGGVIRSCERES